MTKEERYEMTHLINALVPDVSAVLSAGSSTYLHAYKIGDLDALRCYEKFRDSNVTVLQRTIKVMRKTGITDVFPVLSAAHIEANRTIIALLSKADMDLTNGEYGVVVSMATVNYELVDLIADLWINRNVRSEAELKSMMDSASKIEKPLVSGLL